MRGVAAQKVVFPHRLLSEARYRQMVQRFSTGRDRRLIYWSSQLSRAVNFISCNPSSNNIANLRAFAATFYKVGDASLVLAPRQPADLAAQRKSSSSADPPRKPQRRRRPDFDIQKAFDHSFIQFANQSRLASTSLPPCPPDLTSIHKLIILSMPQPSLAIPPTELERGSFLSPPLQRHHV